jgi:glycosyltransferase involved in cell wall biosynthesis
MRPDLYFMVVGDGPFLPKFRELEQTYSPRLIVTGYQREVSSLYPLMSVLVMPSRSEGLPMVALEALACGVPIVAAQVGGLAEVVRHGRSGFLCPPEDVQSLCDRLEALLTQPHLRSQLSQFGKADIQERFSAENMVTRTLSLYRTPESVGGGN